MMTSIFPFELHITVGGCNSEDIQKFQTVCHNLGIKSIVLELTSEFQDVMTSSVIVSDNEGAHAEARRISQLLSNSGFTVIRQKIETVPWHPAALQDKFASDQYFECHLSIKMSNSEKIQLQDFIKHNNLHLHLSKNIKKKLSNNDFIQMATFRSDKQNHWSSEKFRSHIDNLKHQLEKSEIIRPQSIEKETIEFCLFDSNVNHDNSWLKKDQTIPKVSQFSELSVLA